MTDVIFIVDLEGTITYVNPAMERLSGYTSDEIEGSPISRFVHPDDRLGLRRAFSETLAGVKTAHEFRVLDRAGVVRWVSTRSTVVVERGIPIGVTGVMTDFTERKHAEEELARLNSELAARAGALEAANAVIARRAATDDLTGLANCRSFHESLVRTISSAQRHESAVALVSFDLDHFKQVNDTAGHEAGDLVLASFGALLASLCRAGDLPGRLGGDEFSVLLPGTDDAGAREFAKRVIDGVRDCEPLNWFGVTISAGVAAWSLNELSDALLRRADDALYAATRAGGDGLGEGAMTPSAMTPVASVGRPRRVA